MSGGGISGISMGRGGKGGTIMGSRFRGGVSGGVGTGGGNGFSVPPDTSASSCSSSKRIGVLLVKVRMPSMPVLLSPSSDISIDGIIHFNID